MDFYGLNTQKNTWHPSIKSEEYISESDETQKFSWFKMIYACATIQNIKRISSFTFNYGFYNIKKMISYDEEVQQEAKINIAKNTHKLCKTLNYYGKFVFGDSLLVPSRNIATKKSLTKREDEKAYIEFHKNISDAIDNGSFSTIIGFPKSFILNKSLAQLKDLSTRKSAKIDGICFASSFAMIGKIFDAEDTKSIVKQAKVFEKGCSGEVAAFQEIYEELNWHVVNVYDCCESDDRECLIRDAKEILFEKAFQPISTALIRDTNIIIDLIIDSLITQKLPITLGLLFFTLLNKKEVLKIVDTSLNTSNISTKTLNNSLMEIQQIINDLPPDMKFTEEKKSSMRLNGFKSDREGTFNAKTLINASSHSLLEKQLKNFNQLAPGVYQISFSTRDDGHSIAYKKLNNGESFLFDPNYGLIKCEKAKVDKTLLKLLRMYPPIYHRNCNKKENYNLDIQKFNRVSS